MNSYFRSCELCGKTQPLNELLFDGKGFLTCLDPEPCMKRVASPDQALLIAKTEEYEANEKTRNRLIAEIAELREKLGIEQAYLAAHKAELARIEAE
jgi:hypothetical protein